MNEQLIENWLKAHDPQLFTGRHGIATLETTTLLGVAADTMLAPSQSALVGDITAAKASNEALQAALGGDDQSKKDSAFVLSPVNGAMSIAQMAMTKAGYDPTNLDNAGANDATFKEFRKSMAYCPYFTVALADTKQIKRETSDWNTIIDSIADTFVGIAAEDKNQIVSGLKSLAKAASSKSSATQKESLFTQSAIQVTSDSGTQEVTYYMYSAVTSFVEKMGKGFDVKTNEFDITRIKLTMVGQIWQQYAAKITNENRKSIDDWLGATATSTAGAQNIPALDG